MSSVPVERGFVADATLFPRYPSVVHGTHYGFPKLETSIAVDRDAREGLKWLLSLTA